MIEVERLTKRYGTRVALSNISFRVEPGTVTGFLGPNGSGKSTTMRIILGLDRPTAGRALINGSRYVDFADPLRQVGALLEARSAHPSRTAFDHLLAIAATHGISRGRVHDVIDTAGLDAVANKRVGGFSLGMGQRLGIAVALLGDPRVLVLDEPVNGLDPDGVLWVRQLCRDFADDGRTVFLSSHLMGEMALVADRVIVLGRGHVLADGPLDALLSQRSATVWVRSSRSAQLKEHLERGGARVSTSGSDALEVAGVSAEVIGEIAAQSGVALSELRELRESLEDAYLRLTEDDVEYRTARAME